MNYRNYVTSWTWEEYFDRIRSENLQFEMRSLSRIDAMEEFPLWVDRAVDGILARMRK